MERSKAYEMAFAYKKAKLWKKLWDNDVFAVKLSSGEIGYISIMGQNGEYCALGLYIGEEGMRSYIRIMDTDTRHMTNPFEFSELMVAQNCLQMELGSKDELHPEDLKDIQAYAKANGIKFSGKNAYPVFSKIEPGHFPWRVTDQADIDYLAEALEVSVAVAEALEDKTPEDLSIYPIDPGTDTVPLFAVENGKLVNKGSVDLPVYVDTGYEPVVLQDEIALSSIAHIRKSGTWEVQMVRMQEPAQISQDMAPYFPLLILAVDRDTGYLFHIDPVILYEEKPEQGVRAVISAMRKAKAVPKKILVRDPRTYALLEDFCSKVGIKLDNTREDLNALDEVIFAFWNHFEDDEEDELFSDEDAIKLLNHLSAEELRALPEDLQMQIRALIQSGAIPDSVARDLKKKFGWI